MTVKVTISSLGSYVTTGEAARILGCRDDYIYRLVKTGALSCVRVGNKQGGTLLYKITDLEALAAERPRLGKNRKAS